jgi:hypothetical protein
MEKTIFNRSLCIIIAVLIPMCIAFTAFAESYSNTDYDYKTYSYNYNYKYGYGYYNYIYQYVLCRIFERFPVLETLFNNFF